MTVTTTLAAPAPPLVRLSSGERPRRPCRKRRIALTTVARRALTGVARAARKRTKTATPPNAPPISEASCSRCSTADIHTGVAEKVIAFDAPSVPMGTDVTGVGKR
jgi:hypothetical protein